MIASFKLFLLGDVDTKTKPSTKYAARHSSDDRFAMDILCNTTARHIRSDTRL